MKIRTIATLALALALGACASEEATDDAMADATPEASADAQAVTELAEYWATHYNMGHPGMVAGKYADEAWFLSSDGTLSEGSEAIETFLGSTAEMNPQVVITPGEVRVFGDQAVGVGMYEMTLSPEGAEPVSYGGSYMTHNVKVDGAWVIAGHIGNLTDDPFEGFEFSAPEGEAGENQGTMGELTGGWATHYNLGHASMVADYHTEDAMVSLSRGGQVMGREAISTALSGVMEARPGTTSTSTICKRGSSAMAGRSTAAGSLRRKPARMHRSSRAVTSTCSSRRMMGRGRFIGGCPTLGRRATCSLSRFERH